MDPSCGGEGPTDRQSERGGVGGGEGGPFQEGYSPLFPPSPASQPFSPVAPPPVSLSLSFSAGPPRPVLLSPLLFSRLRQSREGSPFGGGGPTTDCRGQRREGTSQSFIGASAVEKGENRQEVERAPPLLRRRSCCELRSERRRKIIPQSKSKALASQSVVSAQLQFFRRQTRLS